MATEQQQQQQETDHKETLLCYPLPKPAVFILLALFVSGFGVAVLILIAVRNASMLVFLVSLAAVVVAVLVWNGRRRGEAALRLFLEKVPESDLRDVRDGQFVKVTGAVSCGSISVESSYEKVAGCIYTSTLLYEYKPPRGLRIPFCLFWRLTYSESMSTDFYISDPRSGIRASVKAGHGASIVPLVAHTTLIDTPTTPPTSNNFLHFDSLSRSLRKWLDERYLPPPTSRIRLREGFIREGDNVTVFGVIRLGGGGGSAEDDDIATIVQPPQVLSTGCLWFAFFLPMDFDGLILATAPSPRPSQQ